MSGGSKRVAADGVTQDMRLFSSEQAFNKTKLATPGQTLSRRLRGTRNRVKRERTCMLFVVRGAWK
jgi:hypothetical protein